MNLPKNRNVVVLAIDRLGANMLGAYGSTWFETPNFNRLAARSLVFDQAITDTTDLESAYESLWKTDPCLMERLGQLGSSSTLLTDQTSIASLSIAESFDRIIPVAANPIERPATSIGETESANFFAHASQAIAEMESESLLWIHSRGLSGAWDAPTKLRNNLADSEDPEPPSFCAAPSRMFDSDVDDPDELLGYQQVCAAQVTMLDDFLGVILDQLDSGLGQSTMFILMSTRGFPLGEHGLVGEVAGQIASSLHGESLQVPLMICLPQFEELEDARAVRIANLVQPRHLLDTWICNWMENPVELIEKINELTNSLPSKLTEAVFAARRESPENRAAMIQTHAWKLIQNFQSDLTSNQLFAKPDDRCEVNDVSRRCPQIVATLAEILADTCDNTSKLPADFNLPEELAIRSD